MAFDATPSDSMRSPHESLLRSAGRTFRGKAQLHGGYQF
jgi:hypothetical protein